MKIYFLGICGTAMGNVACLLKSQGHEVAGSDHGIYPPMSGILEAAGIEVWSEHDPQRCQSWQPELVVVGNAITRGNPIVEWLLETRAVRFVSLPEIVREQLLRNRPPVVIAGTHGKTTTASLTAALLQDAGAHPGWLIGGVPQSLESGCALGGEGAPFVIEGDEYDSAFFDKRSKFIHYFPRVLVLNNMEFDHADIFRDLNDIRRSFSHLIRLVPGNGTILTNGDDKHLETLFPVSWTESIRVGFEEQNNLRIVDFKENPEGASFSLQWWGREWGRVKSPLPGAYNARNAAMAALGSALALGLKDPTRLDLSALERFRGVRRRQEIHLRRPGVLIVEDFGHHPTAIRNVLESLRNQYPEAHLAACFEPRSNTSSTGVLQSDWERAFRLADSAWLAPIYRVREISIHDRLNRDSIVMHMEDAGKEAFVFDLFSTLRDALLQRLKSRGEETWVVVFFSNGAFGGILPQCVEALED